jgi:hypothetical protein
MASIGVQLVKYVLHLLHGTSRPARGSRPRRHLIVGWRPRRRPIMCAGRHGDPRLALVGGITAHDDKSGAGPRRPTRDEPARWARASALARTTSGSRGSIGASSSQERSRRILGLSMRMRFISPPVPMPGIRRRGVLAVFEHQPALAPAVRRTPHRPPHEPSASARLRSPGGRRIPEPPAGRSRGRRGPERPRRPPAGLEPRSAHRSAAAPTRTEHRPRPCWRRNNTSLA